MSRNGTLLIIEDGSEAAEVVLDFRAAWPGAYANMAWPRSVWLRELENALRTFYPEARSADIRLTARHYAPFALAAGANVP